MNIYIGADHRGFKLKALILKELEALHYPVTDLGTDSLEPVDYPAIAKAVSQKVVSNQESVGILLCSSGQGMAMAANKVAGIRAALVWDSRMVKETRADNNANILVLPADYLSFEAVQRIIRLFLTTPFSEAPRHQRRLTALAKLDQK